MACAGAASRLYGPRLSAPPASPSDLTIHRRPSGRRPRACRRPVSCRPPARAHPLWRSA